MDMADRQFFPYNTVPYCCTNCSYIYNFRLLTLFIRNIVIANLPLKTINVRAASCRNSGAIILHL